MALTVLRDIELALPSATLINATRSKDMDRDLGLDLGNGTRSWSGIVALGSCQFQKEVASTPTLSTTPTIFIAWETCPYHHPCHVSSLILTDYPLNKQYTCLSWLLRTWIYTLLGTGKSPFAYRKHHNASHCQNQLLRIGDAMHRCAASHKRTSTNFHRLRQSLRGRVLTLATIHRPPFTFVPRLKGGQIDEEKVTGFDFEILQELQGRLGFRFKLVYSYDGNWGAEMANGTFNGMVGMVARKEADLGVAPFTVTLTREKVIDFTFPYFTDPAAILIPRPRRRQRIEAFLDPFTQEVWLAIATSLLILGPCMALITWTQDYHFVYPHEARRGNRITSVFGYYWMLTTALLQQGVSYPMSNASRAVFGGWILGVVAFTCAYTGVLISFLTVPRVESSVESLRDLARQKELQWTFRKSSALGNLFMSENSEGVYREIGKPFDSSEEGLMLTDDEGVQQVLTGKHAFIKEKSFLDHAIVEDSLVSGECRLALAKTTFFPANFGWIFPNGDPVKILFDKEFIRMQETGLFDKWKQKYWPRSDACAQRSHVSSTKAMDLFDFMGAFTVLGSGFLLGLVFVLLECGRRKKRRNRIHPRRETGLD